MPSYTQYKRQMSVVIDSSDEDITWITVKGNHIPIKKGQNKGDAIKEFFESKKSGSSKSDKGATSKSAPAKSESKSAGKKSDNGGSKGNFNLKKTYGDLWDKHKIESGSALYEDDTKAMKVFNDLESELKKHGINELSDDVYNDLEDNNYHSLNMMLSLSGKFGKEKQKNALAQIERWEKNGYKGSSFSTSAAKKMAQGESDKPEDILDWDFKDVMKLPASDPRVHTYIAKNNGISESTVAKMAEAFNNSEDLYMEIDRISDKKGYGWDKPKKAKAESKPLGTYEYHTDPGHGWLKVPMKEIEELGIKITEFSYQDGDFGYLEEDLDAGTFMRAYKEKYGKDPEHTTHHSDNWSHIREMRRFPKPKED